MSNGLFDHELQPDGWFDPETVPAGWFDRELVAATVVLAVPSVTFTPHAMPLGA
jgi:hypothetical protein